MRIDENTFLDKYISHLNANQQKAVQTVDGPILLLAVPGSGKTTVLVNRLGYMVFCKGINPDNILTLTYTVAATNDMSRRFASIFGEEYSNLLEFRTINSICLKIIRYYADCIGRKAPELVPDDKATRLISDILVKHLSDYPTESDIKTARSLITYCKNMMLTDEEIEELGEQQDIELLPIYKEYNQYLKANKWMDFDDQMVYAYTLMKSHPDLLEYYKNKYRYICVDEAQDTSKIQHLIIGMLAGSDGNLFMVGDEDQSIYGFRAAYPEALLNFEKDHPKAKVLIMDQNYRSNAKIVSAADMFIQRNTARHEKHMVPTKGPASDINYIGLNTRSNQYNYLVKVATDCNRETAVLYRENECALPLIDLLDRQKIPYRIKSVDMAFFTNRVVTDVTNILKFAQDPYNTELFMRIYFKCQTYLRKNQAEQMCRISVEKKIPVLNAAEYVNSINGMVKGKCRGVQTNLRAMLKEQPSKALFRIENPMGYGDYLERSGIDTNKLFILKMLSYNEHSIGSFLGRLSYLQRMLAEKRANYDCKFILSTIHSSKGLEYDQVYLMDVCDGVFPNSIPTGGASQAEKKAFEEERRLFYVGMTRAKNDLNIFNVSNENSRFISELLAPEIEKARQAQRQSVKPKNDYIEERKMTIPRDYELLIGERVVQATYGPGTVTDVSCDDKGRINRFDVAFDSGEEKTYGFPMAFSCGMSLENGEILADKPAKPVIAPVKPLKAIAPVKKPVAKKAKSNTYAWWANQYPDYVVIKREGAFWTCRGESAETLSELLGYRLGGSDANPMTGSPNLDPITDGLRENRISYIVVEDGDIIEKKDY